MPLRRIFPWPHLRRLSNRRRPARRVWSYERLEERVMLAVSALGDELLLNRSITRGQDLAAESVATAMNDAGELVVAFQGRGPGDRSGVFARRFDAAGEAVGDDFRISQTRRGAQSNASAALADAVFMAAWQGRGPGDRHGVFARRFDLNGQALDDEFLVNTTTGGFQEHPVVAMSPGGESIVVWSGTGAGDLDGIFLRRFDATGTPLGPEQLVNETTDSQQAHPTVDITDEGDVVVSWSSRHQDGSDWGVYAQRFAADGSRIGGEFQVNSTTSASQVQSSVASDDEGNFVVTYSSRGQDGDSWGVFGRRFDFDGQPIGDEFQINESAAGHQRDAKVDATDDGDFLVTFATGVPDGSGWEVAVQFFNSDGTVDAGPLQVNRELAGFGSGHQQFPSVAVSDADTAVVAWSGRGAEDRRGVFLQRFEVELGRPVVDLNGPNGDGIDFAATFRRNAGPTAIVDTDLTVNDPDSETLQFAAITLTNALNSTDEVLAVDTTGTDVSANYDAATGVLSLSGENTLADYQQVLRTLTYDNLLQVPDDSAARIVTVVVSDGINNSPVATSTVTVVFTNSPPDLQDIADRQVMLDELVTITATATDEDVGDVLTFQLDQDISPADATLDQTDNNTAIIRWSPEEDDGPGPFPFLVQVTDAAGASDQESFMLTLPAAPAVDLNGPDGAGIDFAATFSRNADPAAIVDTDLTVSDPDSETLQSATVTLTNALDGANEILAVDTTGTGVAASYDTVTGILSLSGEDTLADYQQVLRTLTYDNLRQVPDDSAARIVTVVVNDGRRDSPVATSTVTVLFANSGPGLQDIADQQSMVGQPVQLTVTAMDPDRGDILTFQLDPEDAPPRATLEQLDNNTAVIRWTPDSSDGSGPFLFRVLVTDALGLSDQESFTVTIQ